jgi:hypothetical protein
MSAKVVSGVLVVLHGLWITLWLADGLGAVFFVGSLLVLFGSLLVGEAV